MWVGEEPGAFPWSQLEAAREHLTAMPRGKVEAHLHARGSHRPAAGVPLAGGTGTAGPGASVAAPVPANYEVRRSDEIRRMQDYERGLDRRISGSRD